MLEQINEYLKQIVTCNQKLIHEIKVQNENYNKQYNDLPAGMKSVSSNVNSMRSGSSSGSINDNGASGIEDEIRESLLKIIKENNCRILKVKFIERVFGVRKGNKYMKVDFKTKLGKRASIKAVRVNKMSGTVIGLPRRLLNEILLLKNFISYREAKDLKKEGIVKYVWMENARVFVKKKEIIFVWSQNS